MAKRTVTSKGMRVKVRQLNKANESLGADLKATRIALGKKEDELRTEQVRTHELTEQLKGLTDGQVNGDS